MSLSLKDKTFFITGASRGIGLAIAPRDARDSASIAIAAKTETPHPKLEGTVHSAAEAIEKAGDEALPLIVDVRDEAAVKGAIHQTAALRIARHRRQQRSAISLSLIAQTDMKRFDRMHGEGAKPAHPDAIPATRHGGKMVRAHTGYTSYPHRGVNLELPIERTTLLWFDPTRRPAWLPAL